MNTAAAIIGLVTACLIGCIALGIWIVWEFTGISNRLKKW